MRQVDGRTHRTSHLTSIVVSIMPLTSDKRSSGRVQFSKGVDVKIVAIDGTWARSCTMIDVSQSGAKLVVEDFGSLKSREFFLVLSSSGTAFRRCELAWVNGEQVGVNFLKEAKPKKQKR